jgi:hypothetical protein
MSQERIGVVGVGSVGRALGRSFVAADYPVRFGVRDPDRTDVRELTDTLDVAADTVGAVADWADVLVLAVPADAVDSVFSETGSLSGVVVVDSTNRYPTAGAD